MDKKRMARRFAKLEFLSSKCSKQALLAVVLGSLFIALLLAFLAYSAFALNVATGVRSFTVGGLVCEVNQTCRGGWTDMFHISNISDAHSEMSNSSEYAYRVCCVSNETEVNWLGNNCSQKYWLMLHISNETNAHVELPNNSQHSISLCMNINSTRYVFNWTYTANCSGYGTCVASISNDTNAHAADCGADTSYSTKLCADIVLDKTIPAVTLLSPSNGTNSTSPLNEFNYTVDDDNNIANCSLIMNGTVVNTSTSITKQVNQTFMHTLMQGVFNWSVNCTDSASNVGASLKRRLVIRGMSCEVAASCQAGYYDLFHMYALADSHAELYNESDYTNKVCCKSNYAGTYLTANYSEEQGSVWVILHLKNETNSHVETRNHSSYNISVPINLNATAYVLNCSYKYSCGDEETCVATLKQENNSHVADCTTANGYSLKICCGITEDTTFPVVNLVGPPDNHKENITNTISFVYNVSDDNVISNCSLYIGGAFDQADTTITKDTNQTFLKVLGNENYTWYVRCTDRAVHVTQSETRNLEVALATPPSPVNVTFVLPTPDNEARQVRNWIFVNVTADGNESKVDTCLLGWNSAGAGESNITMNKTGTGSFVGCWANITTIDGTTYTYRVSANSSNATAGNTSLRSNRENSKPSNVSMVYPGHLSTTINRTEQFNWSNASDDDGDPLIYEVNVTCLPSCSIDNKMFNSSENENWTTLTSRLRFFWDENYYYNWTVRVWDGYEVTEFNSTPFTLKLSSSVAMSMVTDSVNFSALTPGQSNDTETEPIDPLVIQNDGNCFIDVNISSTISLWQTQSLPSDFFKYKVDNVTTEKPSFNWTASVTTWNDVPTANTTVIDFFNYTDATDSAEIDLQVTVPQGEGAGNKWSTLQFTGWYVKEFS
jgi:hypothetical protein